MFRLRRRRRHRYALRFAERYLLVYLLLLIAQHVQPPPLSPVDALALKCSRTPVGHGPNKTPADGRFHVRISENTDKYTPGQTYTSKTRRRRDCV